MVGKKFGKLTVMCLLNERKHGQKVYSCVCDCGNTSVVLGANLRTGNSTSCGCLRKATCSILAHDLNYRHGETDTKLWRTWKGMVERTTNPSAANYARYGGRGIGLHPDWMTYENFALHIGEPPTPQHSIDRINNNKGYEPGNVRWATNKEQSANRSTNVYVVLNGKTMMLSQVADVLGISKSSASRWFAKGKLQAINA